MNSCYNVGIRIVDGHLRLFQRQNQVAKGKTRQTLDFERDSKITLIK